MRVSNMQKIFLSFLLLAALPLSLQGIDEESYQEKQKDYLQTLRKKILITNFINNLELTPKQLFEIYSIALTYDRKHKEYEKQYKKVEDETKRAFIKLKKALLKSSDAPKEIGGPASRLEKKIKDMKLAFNKIIEYHQHELFLILTPEQQRKAIKEPPKLIPTPKGAKNWHKGKGRGKKKKKETPNASLDESRVMRFLEQVRGVSNRQYEKVEKKIVEGRIRYMAEKIGRGLSKEEANLEAKRFQKVLQKVRSLPENVFQAQTKVLARAFRYKGLDEMEKEMAQIGHKWSGQKNVKTNLGKFLLDEEALPILKRMLWPN